jgi:glycine betaine/choline ABC-type transport system substrate-binding protein
MVRKKGPRLEKWIMTSPSPVLPLYLALALRHVRFLSLFFPLLTLTSCSPPSSPSIRVGGKNFTEQLILAEITAQHLERSGLAVTRIPGFGGTSLVHQALVTGALDVYIEYSGTAWQVNLQEPPGTIEKLRERYRERFAVEIFPPLGFQNGYTFISRRGETPATLEALAPLAPSLKAGFNAEFLSRPDGWPLIEKVYSLSFRSITNLDAGLIYRALDTGSTDIICGFSTDARLASDAYQIILDNKGAFPRYDAAPLATREALERHPGLGDALASLRGCLNETTMRELNRQAEEVGRPIPDIVRDWLLDKPIRPILSP